MPSSSAVILSILAASVLLISLSCLFVTTDGFRMTRLKSRSHSLIQKQYSLTLKSGAADDIEDDVEDSTSIEIDLGQDYKPVTCNFRPIFYKSSFFTVTYPVPFGLNIEKPPKGFPAPIVNKDSQLEGGEKVGDVLRACTCWAQGFDAAGATSDIMMFAGNVKWRKSVFDAAGAPWQQLVDALMSNTNERSDTVTLVFEREIPTEEGDVDDSQM
mmetsp:Transcript_17356/g.29340  ORF Transcript_17356/g.29340 Transcript_17356/m.29340 type:complete len:214 (+) Transcript_17356:77-718(+)|eukprot:CAMPEP_0175012014 /NCGR_PEP_ID=MMETSP0005-20121125/9046_1 /TAXON_ID=420556 /ORGANISM="Ochromonas sp., Strain CCMP1393" /LENGTH=213 /DNA_ID=CAMNT_0016268149 /DNA_START=59 /DNA_END=700 /DNA_ORIENTATION=-